jgi:hypothetical protein
MPQCLRCGVELTDENFYPSLRKKSYFLCIKCYREDYNRLYQKSREEFIEAYGGKCECCGESHHEFLTADHIYNDGAEERRARPSYLGVKFYRDLKAQGWPKDRIQLMCFNCNLAKNIFGYCPHHRETPEARGEVDRGYLPKEIPFKIE